MYLSNLSTSQQTRFKSLGVLVDVENSISNLGKAVELTDDGHPDKPMYLSNLGNSLHMRFEHLGERLDLVAAVCAFQAAAQSKAAYPRHALYAARKWAKVSHSNGDLLSALEEYRMALAILPKVAWLGLDTQSHQVWLTREKPEDLSCLSATCAIQLHLLEEAVELLDLGRSVFWQQASSLRGDLEMLREEEPELAEQLERVGHKLDSGTFAGSFTAIQSHITKFNGMEDAGRERRRLVGVWDELLERVRRLPKFEYFLQPKPFLQIQQAATTGQVIIINVSQYGVDALCFGPTGPIMHVPLANIDLDTLAQLSSDILLNRPISATASQQRSYTNHYLKPALRVVWNDILAPIFHKIHLPMERIENEKRRVWWYPTGPLTFIPIHAAGPGREALDVSHLVVSSYVTTLQSLSEAQKRKCLTSQGRLKLLAISQPSTPKQSPLPYAVEEVEKVTRLVISAGWSKENIVNLSGSDVTMDRVFSELETCSWAHFACHGIQDPVLGMKSAFVLHDGLLELYKIVSKRLSIGQFAFLSICDAASGLRDLPGEAMHLAAGLQFAGYQSIIATMWGISDDDAPKVADNVYHYLLRKGLQGLDPSEAATALNHAVLCLRQDPTITVDRWAPFIHFGI
jgi:CHAT domain-containing protein